VFYFFKITFELV